MSQEENKGSLKGKHVNVAMMTSGGLAPCLSSSIAQLMKYWDQAVTDGTISGVTFRMYLAGYKGVLLGESTIVPSSDIQAIIPTLNALGGSPIGNSRVKLTNVDDCIKKGFVKEGQTPLEVAAQQLLKDGVHVLHTIGGDDTNTQAAQLSKYLLEEHGGLVHVIGMPKTIDNDVYPIAQTLGAHTAAHEGARFFSNVVSECTANPRMLILHECMGRDSGYLTASSAQAYRAMNKVATVAMQTVFPFINMAARDVHAVWIPEVELDLMAETTRLQKIMDTTGCVNIFFGEGTGVAEIVADMESAGEAVPRDAFGHVSLAKINPGAYFSKRVAGLIGAEKVLVQKSGYFARAAPADAFDQDLIGKCAQVGVATAIGGESGCMGQDEDKEGMPVRAIEFERIKGGKPFDVRQEWFQKMLKEIGQI